MIDIYVVYIMNVHVYLTYMYFFDHCLIYIPYNKSIFICCLPIILQIDGFVQSPKRSEIDRNEMKQRQFLLKLNKTEAIGRASLVIILRDVARFTPLLARLVQ